MRRDRARAACAAPPCVPAAAPAACAALPPAPIPHAAAAPPSPRRAQGPFPPLGPFAGGRGGAFFKITAPHIDLKKAPGMSPLPPPTAASWIWDAVRAGRGASLCLPGTSTRSPHLPSPPLALPSPSPPRGGRR
jgi:hypothetical protein